MRDHLPRIDELEQLVPTTVRSRRRAAVETVVGSLEALADHARRSWTHLDARVPLGGEFPVASPRRDRGVR